MIMSNLDFKDEKVSKKSDSDHIKGLILDIQGQSVNDGPGTRTTVFLTGCPLTCLWCSNPESQRPHRQMLYIASKCELSGACIKACPHDAITIKDSGGLSHDRDKCIKCKTMECVEACLYDAKKYSAEYYTVEQLFEILERDRPFWGDRGGVTFSGGEMLEQHQFVLAILKKCRESSIHTAVETTTVANTRVFLEVMQYVDWAFIDIKHMNSDVHKKLTGVSNELILKNIEALASKPDWDGVVVPRVPLIPGYNDSEENVRATAEFVKKVGLEVIHFLPYHRLGVSKFEELNQEYTLAHLQPPTDEHMEHLVNVVKEYGLYCYSGYNTPF
jgi:glycyl-radical enzyme activating protein